MPYLWVSLIVYRAALGILVLPNDVTVSSFPGSPSEYETSICGILSLGRTTLCVVF